jgi:hypothetical protein
MGPTQPWLTTLPRPTAARIAALADVCAASLSLLRAAGTRPDAAADRLGQLASLLDDRYGSGSPSGVTALKYAYEVRRSLPTPRLDGWLADLAKSLREEGGRG